MDSRFWIDAWTQGKTGFHLDRYHDKLVEHFPRLQPRAGQSVLVPLCGKTKDLVWLRGVGLRVHGIELYEPAVRSFFEENGLARPQTTRDADFVHYTSDGIVISCGDFFRLDAEATYDLVYDRAALVALPADLREKYARVLARALKPGGRCLLIAYHYDQRAMQGPPFSVDSDEVERLYGERFTIALVESQPPEREGSRLSALGDAIRQEVYLLEKRG